MYACHVARTARRAFTLCRFAYEFTYKDWNTETTLVISKFHVQDRARQPSYYSGPRELENKKPGRREQRENSLKNVYRDSEYRRITRQILQHDKQKLMKGQHT